jgi:hypothetical protein
MGHQNRYGVVQPAGQRTLQDVEKIFGWEYEVCMGNN